MIRLLWIALCAGASCQEAGPPAPASSGPSPWSSIALPGGQGGIGFDDLRYSRRLDRVLVPAGRTGNLCLVDPESGAVETIPGFGQAEGFAGGHGDGTTSVDEGAGLLFAIDRTRKQVVVADPAVRKIVSTAPLTGSPDYVRYVASTRELWVTEPDAEQIEVFDASRVPESALRPAARIAVPGGPESLVIDETRHRAYTHLWKGTTVAIDLRDRKIDARWPNGCGGSRGIALDEAKGYLFVGCAEGRAVVLDVAHDGKELSRASTGAGVDIVDYDPTSGHLYVPGAKSGTLSILGVSDEGRLSILASPEIPKGSQCVVTDGKGRAFLGDPERGGLIVIRDEQATARDVSFAGTSAGAVPVGWKVEGTNQDGPFATWRVVADATAPGGSNVLALTSPNHGSGSTFNLCWTADVRFEDGALEVSMKSVSGKEDQGGGLIWRVKDKDDYYVCRANPLEGNFRVYCVEEGRRRQLASASLPIASGEWHTLRIEHVGDRIACSLDGKCLLEARDETIRGEGGIGLWTKADAASEFAALKVTPK